MGATYDIRVLSSDQIDRTKWDQCIRGSEWPLIYGLSGFLDNFCPSWEALVGNDYEVVMPLTGRKKWGWAYLYQPFLCAQLGLFGKNLDTDTTHAFLQHIPARYRYIDICLNTGNPFLPNTPGLYYRDNYLLDLSRSLEQIQSNYRENTLRNIRKAEKAGLKAERGFSPDIVIKLARKEKRTAANGDAFDFLQLHSLLNQLPETDRVETWGIQNLNGDWIATALFFFAEQRAYYLLVGNTEEGRESGASHLLIHAFIQQYAGQLRVLDFEGSDVPGLAFFYSGFGARLEKYPCLRWNRLPAWLRWLKA